MNISWEWLLCVIIGFKRNWEGYKYILLERGANTWQYLYVLLTRWSKLKSSHVQKKARIQVPTEGFYLSDDTFQWHLSVKRYALWFFPSVLSFTLLKGLSGWYSASAPPTSTSPVASPWQLRHYLQRWWDCERWWLKLELKREGK